MSLFSKKNKENKESKGSCCCMGNCNTEPMKEVKQVQTNISSVKVLGSGCAKCNALEVNAKEALLQLGMDITIEHVTDFSKIASFGVMSTPALVVNGKVVVYGKVLKTEELVKILQEVQ